MRKTSVTKIITACAAAVVMMAGLATAAPTIFADFNVSEGTFSSTPTASGSTAGVLASSTADRVTTSPLEGAGCEQLVFNTNGAASVRVRFLSGGGTIGNNIAFATSAGTDGWMGFYVKTTNTGWNVQLWIENASVNGGVPKEVIADNEWHLYEWDLDNTAGDADGWGSIAGVITGSAVVADGNHSIDSIVFRNTTLPDPTSVLFLDFVARNDAGSVADLLLDPCLSTSGVVISGPVSTNSNQVTVSGVSASATSVKVYQNSGPSAALVLIGTKSSGITAGDNAVTVSGLVKAASVVATQTIGGQESCVPLASSGVLVGGGANPSVQLALTIRETSSTGPAGDPGSSASGNLHFLGASAATGPSGAPLDGTIVYPSNEWQTVTFLRGTNEVVGDSANAAGAAVSAAGYIANDSVSIQAYAYRTLGNGVTIYSALLTQSSEVTSNDVFAVNWTWDAVPGADGYRLLRSLNFAGYLEYQDVAGNSLNDVNAGWIFDPFAVVTPSTSQAGKSVQWNPSPLQNTNNLPGQWGILESLCFAIHKLDDTGPYDIYIDNIKNGATVIQSFETAPAFSTDYGFRQPSFSGTTSGGLLLTPNVGRVAQEAADTGTKSFHVRFQWKGTNTTQWLRLTTSAVNNPQVNLDEPISIRLLMLPVNAALPTPPPAPSVSVTRFGTDTVLNWTGGHRLQAATDVAGPYTTISPVLSANVWTNITLGAFLSPWTNNSAAPARFFRLVD